MKDKVYYIILSVVIVMVLFVVTYMYNNDNYYYVGNNYYPITIPTTTNNRFKCRERFSDYIPKIFFADYDYKISDFSNLLILNKGAKWVSSDSSVATYMYYDYDDTLYSVEKDKLIKYYDFKLLKNYNYSYILSAKSEYYNLYNELITNDEIMIFNFKNYNKGILSINDTTYYASKVMNRLWDYENDYEYHTYTDDEIPYIQYKCDLYDEELNFYE